MVIHRFSILFCLLILGLSPGPSFSQEIFPTDERQSEESILRARLRNFVSGLKSNRKLSKKIEVEMAANEDSGASYAAEIYGAKLSEVKLILGGFLEQEPLAGKISWAFPLGANRRLKPFLNSLGKKLGCGCRFFLIQFIPGFVSYLRIEKQAGLPAGNFPFWNKTERFLRGRSSGFTLARYAGPGPEARLEFSLFFKSLSDFQNKLARLKKSGRYFSVHSLVVLEKGKVEARFLFARKPVRDWQSEKRFALFRARHSRYILNRLRRKNLHSFEYSPFKPGKPDAPREASGVIRFLVANQKSMLNLFASLQCESNPGTSVLWLYSQKNFDEPPGGFSFLARSGPPASIPVLRKERCENLKTAVRLIHRARKFKGVRVELRNFEFGQERSGGEFTLHLIHFHHERQKEKVLNGLRKISGDNKFRVLWSVPDDEGNLFTESKFYIN